MDQATKKMVRGWYDGYNQDTEKTARYIAYTLHICGIAAAREFVEEMKSDDEIRGWLANRYDCDPDTDIDIEGQEVHVTAVMPNTNERGLFFAGALEDIQWEIERENGLTTAD